MFTPLACVAGDKALLVLKPNTDFPVSNATRLVYHVVSFDLRLLNHFPEATNLELMWPWKLHDSQRGVKSVNWGGFTRPEDH